MEKMETEYPKRTDLNYQNCKYVRSKTNEEDLLVIEAKNTQTGELYSVWLRYDGMAQCLEEIAKMISQ